MIESSAIDPHRQIRHSSGVRLWGIYSDAYPEVNLGGNRDSLRALAALISGGDRGDVVLTDPPASELEEGYSAVRVIRLAPTDEPAERIDFRRVDDVFVFGGGRAELARIVSAGIAGLADEPYRIQEGSVPTHLHLDPTSDPEKRYYEPSSISLVVELERED